MPATAGAAAASPGWPAASGPAACSAAGPPAGAAPRADAEAPRSRPRWHPASDRTRARRLATQRHWLRVEALPGYAHDLNPMELVWGNLKATELANLCPEALDEADRAAHTGLRRIGASYRLCFNFLAHTGLRL